MDLWFNVNGVFAMLLVLLAVGWPVWVSSRKNWADTIWELSRIAKETERQQQTVSWLLAYGIVGLGISYALYFAFNHLFL